MSVAAESAELAVGGLDAGLLAPTHWPRSSLPGRMHGSDRWSRYICATTPAPPSGQPGQREASVRSMVGKKTGWCVLFAVAGIAALFCNIASSASFALIVPDRRQLGDEHLVDEPLELRERAVEAVAHLHVRGHRAERHLQLVRRARMPAARSSDRCTPGTGAANSCRSCARSTPMWT